uniref:Uncharacterized protein n=1 Tax=Arundo donax TaxID=35708 RepID=A0A0A9HAF1_ARUDO
MWDKQTMHVMVHEYLASLSSTELSGEKLNLQSYSSGLIYLSFRMALQSPQYTFHHYLFSK